MPAATLVASSTARMLLFYTCVTPQIGNQCEEGFTLDQAGVATSGFSSNFTTIRAGRAKNMTSLFAVHDTFFENGKGMRKDWEEAWGALQAKLVPLIEDRTVVGFFILSVHARQSDLLLRRDLCLVRPLHGRPGEGVCGVGV